MLNQTLADAFDLAAVSASENVQGPESIGERSIYQLVHETRGATHFLSRHSRLADAMEKARVLNRQDGRTYKTVLWGSGLPVQRGGQGRSRFRGDNILPSLVLHPAAVSSHPDVLPVAAVYRRGDEVFFTPSGEGVPTRLDRFVVEGDAGSLSGVPLAQALEIAERRAKTNGQGVVISVARKGSRERIPTLRVTHKVQPGEGLGELAVGLEVRPVTPAEILWRRQHGRAI